MFNRWLLVVLVGSGVIAMAAGSEATHRADHPQKHKIVYQITEGEKARFVLGNIAHHVEGVGGWQNIEALELVVYGPALQAFVTKSIDPAVKDALQKLQTEGLVFSACGNTMRAYHITLDQLPPGTQQLPRGGVTRIMELEEQGYAYIRP